MKKITARVAVQFSLVLGIAAAVVRGIGMLALAPAHAYTRRFLCIYEGPTDLKELNAAMEKAFDAMKENIKRVQDTANEALEKEVKKYGTIHSETNEALKALGETGTKLQETVADLKARVTDVEQKAAHRPGDAEEKAKTPGQIAAESDEFKAAMAAGSKSRSMAPVTVGSFHKATIVNATGQNQPLVPSQRLQGIVAPGLRRLTVRDLLPSSTTSSNLIEFARELLFTNAAGPQYDAGSPNLTEGAAKPESSLTFELRSEAVKTIAHWIPASRQVLSDAPMLQGYIDGRLRYGLALEEEDELLNGNGDAGNISGLIHNATDFNRANSGDTKIDTLLRAQLQVSLSEYEVSGYVLNPIDWHDILMIKDTTGRYLFADPHGMEVPRIWSKDVVATQSQTQGRFVAGAFNMAAEIFDREDASVRVAEQHASFFTQNLVAILCEERLALVIYRPAAIVEGPF